MCKRGTMDNVKKKISIVLNFTIGIFATLGITLALCFATKQGYSPWYTRLLYFTQQSNIWIGITAFIFAILGLLELVYKKSFINGALHIVKYIFTVSITVTGIVFCTLLAPFADYDVWYFSSIATHVVVPVLAITDYFINDDFKGLKHKHVYLALIPPAFYFTLSSILTLNQVDFGRGETYPYFFLDFNSNAGFFGFYRVGNLPEVGTAYWLIFMFLMFWALAFLYYRLQPNVHKMHKIERTKRKDCQNHKSAEVHLELESLACDEKPCHQGSTQGGEQSLEE